MDLDEIIKDLEHTIEYFKNPKNQVQLGRKYQAEKTLAQLLLYGVSKSVVCDIDKGTRCKDSFPDYKDGKCRICGGQAN